MVDASLSSRFAAHILDNLILIAPVAIASGISVSSFGESDVAGGLVVTLMLVTLIAIPTFQCLLLNRAGQTFGKKIMGIRIISTVSDKIGGFWRIIILRSLIGKILLGIVPPYFLVDILASLHDSKCLHDYLASTRVVEVK